MKHVLAFTVLFSVLTVGAWGQSGLIIHNYSENSLRNIGEERVGVNLLNANFYANHYKDVEFEGIDIRILTDTKSDITPYANYLQVCGFGFCRSYSLIWNPNTEMVETVEVDIDDEIESYEYEDISAYINFNAGVDTLVGEITARFDMYYEYYDTLNQHWIAVDTTINGATTYFDKLINVSSPQAGSTVELHTLSPVNVDGGVFDIEALFEDADMTLDGASFRATGFTGINEEAPKISYLRILDAETNETLASRLYQSPVDVAWASFDDEPRVWSGSVKKIRVLVDIAGNIKPENTIKLGATISGLLEPIPSLGISYETYISSKEWTYGPKIVWKGYPTGISEASEDLPVRVYPNPVETEFTVAIPGNGAWVLHLTDMSGKELKQIQGNESYVSLHRENLAEGMYLLTILQNDKRYVGKVLLQ